jgi:adenosyl cobinamide kinase/adenosyl cobinamide phosphate guanylyltransferase
MTDPSPELSTRTPPDGLTLLIGGARSGKSSFAVEIGRAHRGHVTFIATATALDDDMSQRIRRHRAERPEWCTVEEPVLLGDALAAVPSSHLVIIDCLTLWVANLLLADTAAGDVLADARSVAARAAARPAPTVVISNEVGLGVHPPTALGRSYQDLLGHVNQAWAAPARRTLFMSAGRAVALRDPWEELE